MDRKNQPRQFSQAHPEELLRRNPAVGGVAGLLGAALAHVLTISCDRLGSQTWLRGPYGPQFFDLALYTGIFYGALGLAASRRALGAAIGFFGPFLSIVVPLFVLTRFGGWGMPRTASVVTPQWRIVALTVYSAGIWGTIAAVGALAARGPRWRGLLAAVLGSVAGYLALIAVQKAAPGLLIAPRDPRSFLPAAVNLMDGLFSGLGLCLALSLEFKVSAE